MSGGGKGGSATTEVTVPEYVEEAARRNLNKAEAISRIGYTPYYGPDVAAFTPMQEAAFQNTADAASAFGMSGGNMSAQNLRGGMAAPTSYASGARGYSSAPMYEDALAQLRKERPGQKKYIDSFFIDPVTGAPGSNMQPRIVYTQSPVMGGSGSSSGNVFGGGGGSGGVVGGGGRGGGLFNYRQGPNQNGSAGYGIGGYTSLRDTVDGGGPGKSKILCCAYHNLGYLPREIWRLDQRYGVWLYRNDPELMVGYHAWAAPLADYVQEDTPVAKVVRAFMWPIVKAWAEEMAHNMKPDDYAPNYFGKLIKFVGEPFSRMCGKLKPRKIKEMV